MEELSLHILDVAENATAAGATVIEIQIIINSTEDILQISIKDNGRGMDPEMLANVKDPFVTSRTTRRVGMGISLLEQSTIEADGNLDLISAIGKGTEVIANFKYSHIDRKPLGDIGSTIISLILGNPEIDFICEIDSNGIITNLDTKEIKSELEDVSITNPAVLELIRGIFESIEL